MNKINLYVFSQIVKSCILVFFIFLSIAWLMQLSRLFSVMNNLQIEFLSIFFLSLWLIPNLINVTLPFIIIFGLVLAFLKFDRDKEIIAIFSLGLSTKEIRKPLLILLVLFIFIYIFLNFFFSPFTYKIYKEKEFNLRNLIEFDKINISNFIELDNNLIIDFENKNQKFEDILIHFKDTENNLIYAKEAIIKDDIENIKFTLFDGFKLILNDDKIEKLKFDNYIIEFPSLAKNKYINIDKNTIAFKQLILERNSENNKIIFQRTIDVLITISFILYFYLNVIKKNNYSSRNLLLFIIITIFCITIDNFVENFDIKFSYLIFINMINIAFIHLIGNLYNMRFIK